MRSTSPLARTIACGALASILTHAATAPTLAALIVTPAPAAAAAAQGARVTVPDGTEFTVVTTEEISSKTAVEGDPINFSVNEDVTVGGHVVIAKGSNVKGVISDASKSGRMGKAGQLSIRVESATTVDGQKIKLRASKGKEGDDKTGTTVALVVLFGPLGFLKKGKNAKIKEGTVIKVFTDEEKTVTARA